MNVFKCKKTKKNKKISVIFSKKKIKKKVHVILETIVEKCDEKFDLFSFSFCWRGIFFYTT